MSEPVQYTVSGDNAAAIARSIERGVVSGALRPGDTVGSVRGLAQRLGVSPTTVASAYRDLRQRGVLVAHDRSRTVVGHRPPLAIRLAPDLPAGTLDLTSGNPDPELLPALRPALTRVGADHQLYGDPVTDESLAALARHEFASDGIDATHLAVVGGGLDGIERVLEVHSRLGDHVAVEDPGYAGSLDLLRALGLHPVPMAVDDEGVRPEALRSALDRGVAAVLFVPRAQNPTGAAFSAERAGELRALLDTAPQTLVIEDDHAHQIAGAPHHGVATGRERWAVVRSVAKSLGPGLRVAVLVGDDDTVTRVLGRQRLGTGWVSHLLQGIAAHVWSEATRDGTTARATAAYTARRTTLLAALCDRDIDAMGRSGLNVWIPCLEEVPVVQGLAARGWAVQAGEPYRLHAPPAVRVTIAGLPLPAIEDLVVDLVDVLEHRLGTRRG